MIVKCENYKCIYNDGDYCKAGSIDIDAECRCNSWMKPHEAIKMKNVKWVKDKNGKKESEGEG
jgi:hypothetical protein